MCAWHAPRQAILCDISQFAYESRSVMSDSLGPQGLYSPWNSPGQNTGVHSLSLLQGIAPTQESNQGLLHCMQILYQLNYQGSLIVLCVNSILVLSTRR